MSAADLNEKGLTGGKSSSSDHVENASAEIFFTPEEEKRLLRKMDLHIMPLLVALYMMSFLDRVNIGNARLFGLESDLHLTGNDYQMCVSLLFVTYIPLELPISISLKYIGPRTFIPAAALCWGVVSICTGLVKNKAELIVVRLLLGAFEAGYFPGITFYLTFFYRRKELGFRVFLLFTASAVAGSFGGLLGYGIGHMDGIHGWNAWRWLMILEGIPSVLLGVAAFLFLANDPDSATYLTERERAITQVRRDMDRTPLDDGTTIQWDQVLEGFKDWKVWVLSFGQLGVTVMLYGYATFLPTSISGLGYSAIQTQLLTVPCYTCGAIVYCASAIWSDRIGQRGIFAIVACLVSAVGYSVLLGTWKYRFGAQYAGCIIVAIGLYVSVGIPITWMPNNLPTHYKRATGQGMLFMLSNFAGVISSYIYLTQDAPRYTLGHGVMLGFVLYSASTYTFISFMLRRENKARDRGERDHILVGKTELEIMKLGDKHPEYRYIY